jgi:spore coat protein SA
VVSKMRVAIVAPEQIPVPPLLGGSVEICIYAIAKRLADRHVVTVISRKHPKYQSVSQEGNLTIRRVQGKSYLEAVLRELRTRPFDLIQVDNRPKFAAVIKDQLPHIPVSLYLHSLTYVPSSARPEEGNRILSKPDILIANSISLKQELVRRCPLLYPKIEKVALGADLSRFRQPSFHEQREIRKVYGLESTYNVLFVGRLIPRKGIPVFLQAIRLARQVIPDLHAVIIGGALKSGYQSFLRKLAAQLCVPATFLGVKPHRELHRLYWLGDCLICPSQEHEAFGLVNVEAMASGLPVIASANGGIQEVIRHQRTGFLVQDYHKPEVFAKYIRLLYHHPAAALRLRNEAKRMVNRKYGWENASFKLSRLYEEMLQRGEVKV